MTSQTIDGITTQQTEEFYEADGLILRLRNNKNIFLEIGGVELKVHTDFEGEVELDDLDYISDMAFEYAYLCTRLKEVDFEKVLEGGYLPYLDYHRQSRMIH